MHINLKIYVEYILIGALIDTFETIFFLKTWRKD